MMSLRFDLGNGVTAIVLSDQSKPSPSGMRSHVSRAGCILQQRAVLSLALLTTISACAERTSANPSKTITDSASVSIVTSMRSVWGDSAARIESMPLLRIGAEEAGPNQFSFIGPALLLEGGRLAVVELSVNEVRVFDSSGTHLRSFGRRGRGPGEFGVISALHPKSIDSLFAYDQTERRITILPLENGEVRTVSVEELPTVRGRFFTRRSSTATRGYGWVHLAGHHATRRPDIGASLPRTARGLGMSKRPRNCALSTVAATLCLASGRKMVKRRLCTRIGFFGPNRSHTCRAGKDNTCLFLSMPVGGRACHRVRASRANLVQGLYLNLALLR